VNALEFAGVEVVFADIELDTYGLQTESVERLLTERTRAILIQHSYGLVSKNYADLLALARHRGLRVIEDCAHSTGAQYRGRKVGTYGDVAFYSCEQSKVLTTVQGGLAVTDDPALSIRIRQYRDRAPQLPPDMIRALLLNIPLTYYQEKHPQRWWMGDVAGILYGHHRLTSTTPEEESGVRPVHYGCRMAAPVAAIGLNQLRKLDAYNRRRRSGAERWRAWCEATGYAPPQVIPDSVPTFLRYPVLVQAERKRDTSWAVEQLGIEPGRWYMTHTHPVRRTVLGCRNADRAVRECINLPCLY
jgi:dTDP-4-amino-4,6-dideoxygalactose transaminase